MEDVTKLSDLDLLVESELAAIKLFGFSTYKHENRLSADRYRKELDALDAEATSRGLKTDVGLTPKGRALDHENDKRVVALSNRNRQHIQSRM